VGHLRRQCVGLPGHRFLRRLHRPRGSAVRRAAHASIRHDRDLRRLHDLLGLQPRDLPLPVGGRRTLGGPLPFNLARKLARIFVGEADRHDGKPLYEAIVLKAREMQLAGATVLRGGLGYGHSSHLHSAKILRLSDDLPLVIEMVDSPDKIDAFLPVLDGMMNDGMSSGLVTLQNVQVLHYGRQPAD
jgi:PII-like signaling protein